jgi:hypothetical protein
MTVPSPWVIVPAASPASRPVYRLAGFSVLEDVENPSAMLPDWSIAALPIQRNDASGA